jgi:hypothetical protein
MHSFVTVACTIMPEMETAIAPHQTNSPTGSTVIPGPVSKGESAVRGLPAQFTRDPNGVNRANRDESAGDRREITAEISANSARMWNAPQTPSSRNAMNGHSLFMLFDVTVKPFADSIFGICW